MDVFHDTQSSDCHLVINLGSFPTRTNSGEGGEPSFINDDDDEDEEAYSLDDDEEEEEEINEDEANDDNDIVDTTYYSMTDVSSRHHGGDGGNEDPHGPSYRVHTGCKSSQPKKRRGHGKNLNLQAEWVKNGNKPIPIKFVHSTNLFKAVGKNASKFVRSISNELDETAPFQITSWDQVPKDYKIEATGRANYIDGWREMHSKNGNIENIHAQNAWVSHLALHL
ncbi:hypothetical protein QVD17_13057 [Tagetes erecta]|uniref:Uncharacterized protein n=1 Tax=Tagetes erecta TaxID=13708 RepID=A0AAD8KXD2_TARER|nr:hypothetical protein QVD17_13057 [Tagetes erecta]